MIIHTMQQGSEEWRAARIGKMTGSSASVFLVNGKNGNGLGVGAVSYIYKKVAELVTGDNEDWKGNYITERGKDFEDLAISAYEEETFHTVERIGFVELNDFVGCSPDGLVNHDGIIEIKCPMQTAFVKILYNQLKIEKSHMAQIQFNLFVTDRDWCDYIVYHPKFKEHSLVIKRINRNEEMIKVFREKAKVFESQIRKLLEYFES